MSLLAIIFLLVGVALTLCLSRQWAPLPLLVGACYMTYGQQWHVGPFTFTVVRLLLLTAFLRVTIRGEQMLGFTRLDKVILLWACWALSCSIFHQDPVSALVYRLGLCYNILGAYFLGRIYVRSKEDLSQLFVIIALLLMPLAVEMFHEKLTGQNGFAIFGRVLSEVSVRNGKLRAQGPFANPILAGTVGGCCIPLMFGIRSVSRSLSTMGIVSCLVIVWSSASSGPAMGAVLSIGGLILWRWHDWIPRLRIGIVVIYALLEVVMHRPPYFILASIDLAGGSTGYYRAQLIRSSIEHLNEWWFAGTDFTRHWLATGAAMDPNNVDIANQFLANGVQGGLLQMGLFVCILWIAFVFVGKIIDVNPESGHQAWILGTSLFAYAISGISVSYFDQSFIFLYFTVAGVGSLYVSVFKELPPEATSEAPCEMDFPKEVRWLTSL